MPVAYVGAAAAVASTVNSLTSGSNQPQYGGMGSSGSSPYIYQPTAQSTADQYAQGILGNMYNFGQQLPGQVTPQIQGAGNAFINNPYAKPYIQGASQAGNIATGTVAPAALVGAGNLYGLSNVAAPYGAQLLNTAFDPQTALYNRTQQQVMDQINANAAQSGLAGSPYAAGLAQQGLTNFNIDWQNAQLQRQMQGAQGYGNLLNAIGQGYQGAAQLGTGGVNTLAAGYGLPYNAYTGVYSGQLGGLNQELSALSSAYGIPQQTYSDALNYMGYGQSAGNLALGAQQQAFNQNAALGQNLGNSLGQLTAGLGNVNWGNVFGPSTSNTPGYNAYTGGSTFGSQFGTSADYGGLTYGF